MSALVHTLSNSARYYTHTHTRTVKMHTANQYVTHIIEMAQEYKIPYTSEPADNRFTVKINYIYFTWINKAFYLYDRVYNW